MKQPQSAGNHGGTEDERRGISEHAMFRRSFSHKRAFKSGDAITELDLFCSSGDGKSLQLIRRVLEFLEEGAQFPIRPSELLPSWLGDDLA
jgi:hypothetical protein